MSGEKWGEIKCLPVLEATYAPRRTGACAGVRLPARAASPVGADPYPHPAEVSGAVLPDPGSLVCEKKSPMRISGGERYADAAENVRRHE